VPFTNGIFTGYKPPKGGRGTDLRRKRINQRRKGGLGLDKIPGWQSNEGLFLAPDEEDYFLWAIIGHVGPDVEIIHYSRYPIILIQHFPYL